MKRFLKMIDGNAPLLAVLGSIALHLSVVLAMRWHDSRPKTLVIEKPKVSRIRILSNPNGNPRAVAPKAEVKAPPVAKPQPKTKTKVKKKPKIKPKAKPKMATKAITKPQKAPDAPPPPPQPANNAPQSFGDSQAIGMVGKGISNTNGPSDPNASTDWLPIEQEKPKMPREAQLKGIEGFITFVFDINEDGRVENIKVASAENRSVFEQEARRAIRKFRYNPRKINGRPVKVVGHSFTVVFKLTH